MRKERRPRLIMAARFAAAVCVVVLLAACKPPASQTVRFIVTGDSRGSYGGSPINAEILNEIAAATIAEGADFILFPGDLVWGLESMGPLKDQLTVWRTAMQPVYDAGIGVYPVRGNHEMFQDTPDGAEWKLTFSGDYALPGNGPEGEKGLTYSFTYKNVFVAALDTYVNEHTVNQAWLDGQFAANEQPHVFVFGHEPAFKAQHEDCLDDNATLRNIFWESIVQAGARAYFCAHDHFYSRARIDDGDGNTGNDAYQIIVATAGADFYTFTAFDGDNAPYTPENTFYEGQHYGYVLVEVAGKKVTMTWKHRNDEGVYEDGGDSFTYRVR